MTIEDIRRRRIRHKDRIEDRKRKQIEQIEEDCKEEAEEVLRREDGGN